MSSGRTPLRRSPAGRAFSRRIARPILAFLSTEASGGIVLLAATAAALLWINSPLRDSYDGTWATPLSIGVGDFSISQDLRHWVNEGLMAVFFFVVGLEIKRELVTGELSDKRRAVLPAVAAVGGMAVPALLYAALNAGGPGSAGWGIPMATDIAFAVGIVTVMGDRCPPPLRVFLLTLAIVDDIGAIVVIALFYAGGVDPRWLAAAAVLLAGIAMMLHRGIRWTPIFVVMGAAVWLATFQSGVHATIAGVALGLLAPARPRSEEVPEAEGDSASIADRLQETLHPWTSYAIVPLFALANAGIVLGGESLRAAASSPVTLGIILGLVVGKIAGITGASWLAVRLGAGLLPTGTGWRHIAGVAAVAGVGFTVSLFIAELAFGGGEPLDEAKVGVFAASLIAAVLGATLLFLGRHSLEATSSVRSTSRLE